MWIIIATTAILSSFAAYKEITERDDAYSAGILSGNENIPQLVDKIQIAYSYEKNTIHWRRIFLVSVLLVIIIGIYRKYSVHTCLILFLVIFPILFVFVQIYMHFLAFPALDLANYNLDQLRSKINAIRAK